MLFLTGKKNNNKRDLPIIAGVGLALLTVVFPVVNVDSSSALVDTFKTLMVFGSFGPAYFPHWLHCPVDSSNTKLTKTLRRLFLSFFLFLDTGSP